MASPRQQTPTSPLFPSIHSAPRNKIVAICELALQPLNPPALGWKPIAKRCSREHRQLHFDRPAQRARATVHAVARTPARSQKRHELESDNRTSSTTRIASEARRRSTADLLRGLLFPPERSLFAGQGQALPDLSRRRGQPQGPAAAQLCVPSRTHAFGMGLRSASLSKLAGERCDTLPRMRERPNC